MKHKNGRRSSTVWTYTQVDFRAHSENQPYSRSVGRSVDFSAIMQYEVLVSVVRIY